MRSFGLMLTAAMVMAPLPVQAAEAIDLSMRAQPAEETPQPTSSQAPDAPGETPQPTSSKAPDAPGETPQPTSSKAPPAADAPQPTSSKAPTASDTPQPMSSKAPDADPVITTAPPPEEDPAQPKEEVTLEEERGKGGSARGKPFNRHGVGVRGGITIIPTWILARWVETQTNALCRGDAIGNYAESQGLLKTDGCNFYVGADYVYRQSRILDIVGSIGYQRFHTPEGFWLDEYNAALSGIGGNPLSGADYTEVELDMMYIEADFIARAPIVVRDDFEFGLGGGAGVGLGILFGGIYQTPIGSTPDGFTPQGGRTPGTCQEISDLADFTRCTPRWDPDEDPDGVPPNENDLQTPNPDLFATCTKDSCSRSDLTAFGYRKKNEDVPPVIPVVNLIISARFIIKDVFGISINGGFNTGFYFGGSMHYFFGKQFQKPAGSGSTKEGRESTGPSYVP